MILLTDIRLKSKVNVTEKDDFCKSGHHEIIPTVIYNCQLSALEGKDHVFIFFSCGIPNKWCLMVPAAQHQTYSKLRTE